MGTDHPYRRQRAVLADHPRGISVNCDVVKVGWFTSELDPHKILLVSSTAGRWDLLVRPPEASVPLGRPADRRREREHRPVTDATALMTANRPTTATASAMRTGRTAR